MHQEFLPPILLRDAIKCFWYHRRDVTDQFEVLPDSYTEIIFHFGDLFQGDGRPLPSPFIMGLLDKPVRFYSRGSVEIIAIRCFPWTVLNLLGIPPSQDSIRFFNHPIARLQSILAKHVRGSRIDEALALLEEFFLETRISIDTTLFKAGLALQDAHGALPVSQVAAAAHATVRTLERKFRQSSGYTIKDVSALMRFEQVRNQLMWHPNSNLAGLAHEFGYTDQSHLGREFKRYTGTTPGAFARRLSRLY